MVITLTEKRYKKQDSNYILEKESVKVITVDNYNEYDVFFTSLIKYTNIKVSVVKEGGKIIKTEIYSSNKQYKTIREFKN